ncbi:hypothetical protein QJU89_04560 [Pasteurella skyensis]|uniref:Uncharacterized protein n=1 Tax=Phocoenobacter skyensis TaxID=97481 RepID=A0AAJ6P0E2_9PAST|nr:hypothetical protein [Pasteurella skyensis]MDP8162523.1 hypothetical protein [Pasteurella skyensis]MDP8172488.1 hypothetical protein [Pasteurella skyensis]MDP8177513.1 hypothetical protein [Pasteurella skyensis]MDP8178743.1 hypothetical protein [Pasteurella skyensis]MDP8182967.1 hypothetical protein [Pasteurella skyensis]
MGFLSKTFGGLSKSYYIRHFLFGLIFVALLIFTGYSSFERTGNLSHFIAISTFSVVLNILYPYSRFVYESVIDYILGDNFFIFNGIIFLFAKFITMLLCWYFSFIIAPIGLLYLYFYHSKQEKLHQEK